MTPKEHPGKPDSYRSIMSDPSFRSNIQSPLHLGLLGDEAWTENALRQYQKAMESVNYTLANDNPYKAIVDQIFVRSGHFTKNTTITLTPDLARKIMEVATIKTKKTKRPAQSIPATIDFFLGIAMFLEYEEHYENYQLSVEVQEKIPLDLTDISITIGYRNKPKNIRH